MVKLGDKVTDSITGFSGIAIARTEYLHGCVRIGVQSESLSDGKVREAEWFDEQRLGPSSATVGGPNDAPRRQADAQRPSDPK